MSKTPFIITIDTEGDEMAMSGVFVEFARDVVGRGAGEIGMHLHAWNSPPLDPLTDDDFHYQPYLLSIQSG